jgi:hypothetical protein
MGQGRGKIVLSLELEKKWVKQNPEIVKRDKKPLN